MERDPQSKNYPRKLIDIQRPGFQEDRSFLKKKKNVTIHKEKKTLKDYPAEQLVVLILIIGSLAIGWILH